MTFCIRAANSSDLQHLYEMAKLTGGGFTNLPPDRETLLAKIERSNGAFSREGSQPSGELFVLVMENTETGTVRGTSQLFTEVGKIRPFYSYRLTTFTQASKELGRTVRAESLSLVTDLEGSSEVGGLFLHPSERAGGLGLLLARSRYLFIAMHRERFGDRILAELRGIIDERAGSPFWDAIGGKFFGGMSFQEADEFNAVNGNQFIADLMPKHPIYTAMLSEEARRVIGLPHPNGRAAMRMLENEGYSYNGYVDLFDGGPTMTAPTDKVAAIADAAELEIVATDLKEGEKSLVACGHLGEFRCCYSARELRDGGIAIDGDAAKALGVSAGDKVWSVAR